MLLSKLRFLLSESLLLLSLNFLAFCPHRGLLSYFYLDRDLDFDREIDFFGFFFYRGFFLIEPELEREREGYLFWAAFFLGGDLETETDLYLFLSLFFNTFSGIFGACYLLLN